MGESNRNWFQITAMKRINHIPVASLILIWMYTGLDKVLRFRSSRDAFLNQPFPWDLSETLAFAVPATELVLAILLFFPLSRWWGYMGSVLALTVFTTYVGLIWVGAFPRVPCNCAGIIESMGWAEHFWMNLGLIGIAIWGLRSEIIFPAVKKIEKNRGDGRGPVAPQP